MKQLVFNPIDQDKLVDLAAGQLLASILEGRIAQGERIVEAEVARQMEISRAPLREAIRRLEARGLLISIPRRGVFVRSYSVEDVEQVSQVRLCIELFVVGWLASKLTPGLETKIVGLESKYAAAFSRRDPGSILEANLAFHIGMVNLLANLRLSDVFAHVANEVRLIHSLTAAPADSSFINPSTYSTLVQSICTGDSAAASTEITRLIEGFRQRGIQIAAQSHTCRIKKTVWKNIKNAS